MVDEPRRRKTDASGTGQGVFARLFEPTAQKRQIREDRIET
jgi:hypothetical protein